MSNNSISPSEIGIDIIGQSDNVTVGEWLNAKENNLVIRYKTKTNEVTNFLLNTETLIKQLNNPRANQIKCPISETALYFKSNENPIIYIDLALIGIAGVVVERTDINKIKDNIQNKSSTRVYEIIPASNVGKVNDMWSLFQSKAPETMRIAPKMDEVAIRQCDAGELFNGKIVEINLSEPLPEPQILEQSIMPPEAPVLGGKRRRNTLKKRKSLKKKKNAKKRKSAKK